MSKDVGTFRQLSWSACGAGLSENFKYCNVKSSYCQTLSFRVSDLNMHAGLSTTRGHRHRQPEMDECKNRKMLAGGNYKAIPYLGANNLSILKASSLPAPSGGPVYWPVGHWRVSKGAKVWRVVTFCQAYFSGGSITLAPVSRSSKRSYPGNIFLCIFGWGYGFMIVISNSCANEQSQEFSWFVTFRDFCRSALWTSSAAAWIIGPQVQLCTWIPPSVQS